ncbi:MAG: ATP-dependent sacrificial sulfur transferase LarE [Candidatus Latescibacteria bacterium]|nr:ATP-dependent sacrificial sulfur transferase LarE [Candidatus Latescibacterota bacterium]
MNERVATSLSRGDASRAARAALEEKRRRLEALLRSFRRTLIAYSGGVDSAVLLVEAHRVLGVDALGVIAESPSLPRSELDAALSLASLRGIAVRVIRTNEMDRERYRENGPDRCYHCKTELFERLERLAGEEGWDTLAYGAVTDDLADVRPGMAAAEELRVRAPLLEAALSKVEVRALARSLGLRVWDKPQSACLASRIPRGTPVTVERLRQVELGEEALRERFGLRVVRLRHEGWKARIEVAADDIPRLAEPATNRVILSLLNGLGFTEVEIDPRGYRRPDPLPSLDLED